MSTAHNSTPAAAPAAPRNEYRAELTARLIGMIETNTAPWQKPWVPTGSPAIPHNAKTGATYRGGNVFVLLCEMMRNGWDDPRFLTYKQAEAAGYQVRKGSKSTTIEYWKRSVKTDTMTDPDTGAELVSIRPRMIHRTYRVFNAAQIDGMPELEATAAPVPGWEPFALAERLITETGADISHNGYDRAFYIPQFDTITLPDRAAFDGPAEYYGTALHELSHWTGHASRLARTMTGGQGSHAYAMEELIAESSTYLLCLTLGIPFNPVQSAAYCQGWAKPLHTNPHALSQALAAGNLSADYLAQFATDDGPEDDDEPEDDDTHDETPEADTEAPAPVILPPAAVFGPTCPECTAVYETGDTFCGGCGFRLVPLADRPADYVIATDGPAPVIIATVTHTDISGGAAKPKRTRKPKTAPAPRTTPENDAQAAPAGILNPYTGSTAVYGADLTAAIKPMLTALRKVTTASKRRSVPALGSIRITTEINHLTVAPECTQFDIEPVTITLGSTSGTELDALLTFDNADLLTHIIDPKKDAVLTIETVPVDRNTYTEHRAHLVIRQQSAAAGRMDTYRIRAHSNA